MIKIFKNTEPALLTEWKARHPRWGYSRLSGRYKEALQLALLQEQGYVCCFCGDWIGAEDNGGSFVVLPPQIRPAGTQGRVAHITPQSVATTQTLNYNNMCYSCPAGDGDPADHCHCDRAQGANELPITPLTDNCHEYFIFTDTGEIQSSGKDDTLANDTITILNLNAGRLKALRQQVLSEVYDNIQNETFSIDDLAPIFSSLDGHSFQRFFFVVLSHFNLTDFYLGTVSSEAV